MVAVLFAGALTACSGGDGIVVGAAASLGEATEALAEAYGDSVSVVIAGTPALLAQARDGAGFDVLLLADRTGVGGDVENADPTLRGGIEIARNTLVLAMPRGNPGGVQSLEDLARGELIVALGAEGVPIGEYARRALRERGISPSVDTLEASSTALLSKLQLNEVDAAIVYATDIAGTDLVSVPIDGTDTRYLGFAKDEGRTFLEFVRSQAGQDLLSGLGFGRAR